MIFNFECLIFDLRRAPATGGGIVIFNFECSPQLRDTLTRGFLIKEESAHVPRSRDALTRAYAWMWF